MQGNREQRLNLWFNATKNFRTYSILWNQRQVVPHKGCECPVTTADSDNAKRCANSGGWWDQPVLSELNVHQSHQLIWVRANHMIYDYCSDTGRLPSVPVECEQHRH
ncbi:putative xyloglucan:xyloglucosyl transferase [Helianthus debilis subsp. tardiflorus]